MKLILKDFNYKGKHVEGLEVEFPQVKDVEQIFDERLFEYIEDSLNNLLDEE